MTLVDKISLMLGTKDDNELDDAIDKLTDAQKSILIRVLIKLMKSGSISTNVLDDIGL